MVPLSHERFELNKVVKNLGQMNLLVQIWLGWTVKGDSTNYIVEWSSSPDNYIYITFETENNRVSQNCLFVGWLVLRPNNTFRVI